MTSSLRARYDAVRALTEKLAEPLAIEDQVVQSMPDASPTKWHLAHVTWFFETFVVAKARPDLGPVDPAYGFLFNSYYDAVGPRHARPERGLLTRPTVAETLAYRHAIDGRMREILDGGAPADLLLTIEVGLNHEQQHQELLLTDVKHALSRNPLEPAYRRAEAPPMAVVPAPRWIAHEGGLVEVGDAGDAGFAYDNERPRHRVFLERFELADRLVTSGEFRAFVEDGGYDRPELWMSDGWAIKTARDWRAPLYWERRGDRWTTFTLAGRRPVLDSEPTCHVSWYEADAFARWAGARLPREEEWEVIARDRPGEGFFGEVWQWTASPYVGYPGFRPFPGALREYNGKFTVNQLVLRGSSCATPRGHARPTYRNFFAPDARWQFSGIRLAR